MEATGIQHCFGTNPKWDDLRIADVPVDVRECVCRYADGKMAIATFKSFSWVSAHYLIPTPYCLEIGHRIAYTDVRLGPALLDMDDEERDELVEVQLEKHWIALNAWVEGLMRQEPKLGTPGGDPANPANWPSDVIRKLRAASEEV